MGNRESVAPKLNGRPSPGIWLRFVIGYPVVLALAFWFASSLLNDSSSDVVVYSTMAVVLSLVMFACAWLAARAGAPTALRWGGLAYAAVLFVLFTLLTMNEATLSVAILNNVIPAAILALGGATWWLGFAKLFGSKRAEVVAGSDGVQR